MRNSDSKGLLGERLSIKCPFNELTPDVYNFVDSADPPNAVNNMAKAVCATNHFSPKFWNETGESATGVNELAGLYTQYRIPSVRVRIRIPSNSDAVMARGINFCLFAAKSGDLTQHPAFADNRLSVLTSWAHACNNPGAVYGTLKPDRETVVTMNIVNKRLMSGAVSIETNQALDQWYNTKSASTGWTSPVGPLAAGVLDVAYIYLMCVRPDGGPIAINSILARVEMDITFQFRGPVRLFQADVVP